MKTVWLLNHYAQDPSGSGGTRHYELAKHAAACGVRIILIAASVEHLTGKQRLKEGEKTRFETLQGVSFLWIRTPSYSGNGAGRVRNMLEYSFKVLKKATTRALPKPDLVIGSSVHPFAALAGQRLARRFRVPFVFEVRDLWPETLIQMGRIQRHGITAIIFGQLEKFLYRRADRIIALLPRAHEYIEQLGIDAGKVAWIPNGIDLEGVPYHQPARHEVLTVMYIGSHGQANALGRILDAIGQLQSRADASNLTFRFVGDGAIKSRLIEKSIELGIESLVRFDPPVSRADVPKLAAEADIFIVNVRDLPLYRYGISLNKLFDYLGAGRPVVFAGSAANDPVADAGAGISVPADDSDAMADAILTIARMSYEERILLGLRGRKHVEEHYAYEQLGRRLCDEILPLTDRNRGGVYPPAEQKLAEPSPKR